MKVYSKQQGVIAIVNGVSYKFEGEPVEVREEHVERILKNPLFYVEKKKKKVK